MGKKNKFSSNRKCFKADLNKIMDKGIAMAIIKTLAASRHRKHIAEIWEMASYYPDFQKKYDENLFGKHFCGEDEIFNTLYFINKDIYKKYKYKVPERFAMGDAYGISIRFLKKCKISNKK